MADKISFAEVQLKPGMTAATSPNAITASDTGGTTDAANRALVAIAGDGDQTLDSGETAYILGAPVRGNAVEGVDALNGADDPVSISTHGRNDAGTVGALGLEASLAYWSRGFGVRNGTESSFGTLSRGDSVTWTLNDDGGVAQRLQKAAFTVDRGGSTGAIEVAIAFDGDVVRTGSYAAAQTIANADAALRLDVNGGDVIAIDFDASILTVNGVARDGAAIAGFFADYAASPQNVLTIGTIGARSFAIGDLVIDRTGFGEAPVNTPPGVSLTPLLTSLPENADTGAPIKVADIVVTDDGIGTNALGLAGADAPSFEIVGTALFLKAGTALEFETKTSFDVTVTVDDASIGAGPDGSVDFTLAIGDANQNAAPVLDAQIADQNVDRGDPVALDVTSAFSDPDGDALTYTVTGTLPAGVSFADGIFSGAIDAAATPGAYQVTVTATDVAGSNTGASDTFVLTVAGGVDTRPTVRIEAEDGTLSGGFSVEKGSRIKTTSSGEATYDLSGVAQGDYLVRIGYWDENDGASSVGVTMSSALAGTFSDTLALDEATPSGNFSSKNFRETTLDGAFKLGANGLLTLTGLAQGSEIVRIDYIELIPTGAPAGNQAPSVSLANVLAGIPENADTGAPIKVADIVVTDDGIGTNALGLAGADAPSFEIVGTALFLKAGTALEFETKTSFDVTVTVDDASIGAGPDGSVDFTLAIGDANQNAAPVLDAQIADQNVDRGDPVALDVTSAFSDPDGDALTYTVTGTLPAGVSFADGIFSGAIDAAATPGAYQVTVTATDVAGSNTGASDTFVLTVAGGVDTRPTVRIEAEDGTLSGGFSVEKGSRIKTTSSGEATYDLSGVAQGDYLVRIGYWDENDGASSVGVTMSSALAGTFSDTLALDEATPSGNFSSKNFRETTLDGAFKLGANGLLTLTGLAQGSEIVRIDYIELIPTGAPAGNQAPSVSLANVLAGIPENADTGAPIKVADIVVTDDGIGTNALGLAGADAPSFEIVGTALFLKAGTALEFETKTSFDVTVTVDDASIGAGPDGSVDFTLAVTDIAENAPPTAVVVTPVVTTLAETASTAAPIVVATIAVTDDGLGTNTLTLSGADAALFEIVDNSGTLELRLIAGAVLDFETNPTLDVTVNVDDAAVGITPDASAGFTLAVTDVDENAPPTAVVVTPVVTTLAETASTAAPIVVATIAVTDDGLGTNTLTLSGADAGLFEIVDNSGTIELRLIAGAVLDFETNPSLDVTVNVDDAAVGITPDASAGFTLAVTDVAENAPPTAVVVTPVVTTLAETASTAAPIVVATIAVTDDGLGTNTLTLSGADAGLFEIVDNSGTIELRLIAGAVLDFETNPSLDVTVNVDDAAVGITPDASAGFTLAVTDVAENAPPTAVVVTPVVTTLAETASTAAPIVVATIAVTDDGLGTNTLTLSGADAGLFEIVDNSGTIELRLIAGAVLDFETNPSLDVTVNVDDAAVGITPDASAGFTLAVTDVAENAPPTAVVVTPVVTTLAETASTAAPIVVATIAVTDDGLGTNTLTLSGADAGLFEIVDNSGTIELRLIAGAVLDFETNPSLDVTVNVDDAAVGITPDASAGFTLAVTDVAENAPPTAVVVTPVVTTLAETASTAAPIVVATIAVTDDGLGTNTLTLSGADAGLFEIVDNSGTIELRLIAGAVLDFETNPSLDVTVNVDDAAVGITPDASAGFTLAVTDVDETPVYGAIRLDGSLADWSLETRLDTPTDGTAGFAAYGTYQAGAFVFALSTDDVVIGPNTTIWLDTDLDPAAGFGIFGTEGIGGAEYNINFGIDGRPALYSGGAGGTLVAAALDFALSADGKTLEIALPSNLMAGSPTKANAFIDVNDGAFLPNDYTIFNYLVGENSPASVSLTPVVTGLPENTDTSARIRVADILVTDDGIGVNALGLAGTDAGLFEIVGDGLYLKAGTALDFETKPDLDVSVTVNDASIGADPEDSAPLTLVVGDVDESFGAITLDGALGDWAPDTRLDTVLAGTPGYSAYGTFDTGAFVFAISTSVDDVVIGPNTTIWLDTDLNPATGFQIFGFAGGAEYNITFGTDGRAALYTGGGGLAEGGTLIEDDLPYFFSTDRKTVEVALPSTLMEGAPNRANVLIDVNNNAFLPGNFSLSYLVEEKLPLLPQDPAARVAIVYSETSADNYFSKTAYGQLFMAAQSQAMQAGIPFDVITESDLIDIANLVKFDSLVFPGFANVQSTDLAQIAATLTSAVEDYRIGLIAMGNFMTNDESGAAIAGNSYARMQALLGVTLDGFGETNGVVLRADTDAHPVSDLYTPGEVVGSYGNNSYLTFKDVSGGGETIFSQTVGIGTETQDVSAVIVTTTGGRNVHFATDAAFGNNNILSEAINWSVRGDAPDVGLQMTRGTSMFFSRNDMDQSQEAFDVVSSNPGIYDEMLPIIEKWFDDYGFVGSYYINVGNNPPDQQTIWEESRPYYERILALDSEIGSHSYTHPDDTNLLTPVQIQFEFEQSKAVIEAELGITVSGAAVPGQPELLPTSLEIIQYYDYLTGGYSSTGAGYPGAFGFLNPANADKVYFAPNVSFDFSLLGFQGLTVSEAEAVWAAEYASITEKGSTPIIHFPWHDYGPTNWETSPGEDTGYTLEMFTNFIERAYLDGTEFVTGEDLAQRIKSFVATDIEIEASGTDIVARVTGSDVGKFALEIDTTQRIASVDDWYAYEGNKVFLPKNGGTFTVSLGTEGDDVTRIIALPMRAELLSANGDGTDLAFTYEGRGETKVDLKAWGASSVVVSGAVSGALAGEILTLTETVYGQHGVAIDYTGALQVTGTDGNDFIIGSDEGRTIDGGLGDDRMFGGGGEDVFVFRDGGGVDTVLDFDLGLDRISLINSGYTDKTAALEAFVLADEGLTLSYTPEDRLVLAGVEPGELTVDHIILDSLFA